MALIYNATFDSQTRILSLLDKAGNVISSCEVPSKDVTKPLTLTATADNSSVALKKVGKVYNTYEYKLNDGAWTPYTLTTSGVAIPLNAGDKIQWRCTNRPTTTFGPAVYVQFVMTGKIEASNPVTSMVLYTLDPSSLGGYHSACYNLFSGCTSLTQAPELPATTLPGGFLSYGCYRSMFKGCTSLTRAPVLPATTLAYSCYNSMFSGCTSLTQAPLLPSTTLAQYCYYNMFSGCTSLTQAPVLPATTLADGCYQSMFQGCTNLSEVRTYATNPTTSSDSGSVYQWLQGVSATGDFYCDPNVTWDTGVSGTPSGWTRHDIADYPQT